MLTRERVANVGWQKVDDTDAEEREVKEGLVRG